MSKLNFILPALVVQPGEIAVIIVVSALGLTFFILRIVYLEELQKTLSFISPANRKLRPGLVWLELIPFFDVIWSFVNIIKVCSSLEEELLSRKMNTDSIRPTYSIGLCSAVSGLACHLGIWAPALITIITCIVFVICWFVFWHKLSKLHRQLTLL